SGKNHLCCSQIRANEPHCGGTHLALIAIIGIVTGHRHMVVNDELKYGINKLKLLLAVRQQIPIAVSFIRKHRGGKLLYWRFAYHQLAGIVRWPFRGECRALEERESFVKRVGSWCQLFDGAINAQETEPFFR